MFSSCVCSVRMNEQERDLKRTCSGMHRCYHLQWLIWLKFPSMFMCKCVGVCMCGFVVASLRLCVCLSVHACVYICVCHNSKTLYGRSSVVSWTGWTQTSHNSEHLEVTPHGREPSVSQNHTAVHSQTLSGIRLAKWNTCICRRWLCVFSDCVCVFICVCT